MTTSSTAAISLPVLTLLAAMAAIPAQAQEEQPVDNEPAASEETTTNGAESESTAPVANDDSPFDYKSSEEISEDLSVSFPVDI